jgi:streptogramin lyase
MARKEGRHSLRNYVSSIVAAAMIALGIGGQAYAGLQQGLWIANGTNVLEFGPPETQEGTHNSAPTLILNSGAFGAPQGVVFDSQSNLWVIDGGTVAAGGTIAPSLEKFTLEQLNSIRKNKNQSLTPTTQISFSGFVFPQQAVFDSSGNLWVSDNGANQVDIFTPQELGMNGNVAPETVILSNPAFQGPLGIVLHDGNLYIANNGGTTIFAFNNINSRIVIGATNTTQPSLILNDDGNGSIQAPWALVFDSVGNLWSSNANAPFTLVKFSPTQIGQTGMSDPTPIVTISPTDVGKTHKHPTGPTDLSSPNGIAFNRIGDLEAVSSATPFGLAGFAPIQQFMSGAPQPHDFIEGTKTTLNAPAGDNFGPLVTK